MVLATTLLPLSLALSAQALSVPFSRRQSSTSENGFDFENNNNETSLSDIYTATMTLNGQDFTVSPHKAYLLS